MVLEITEDKEPIRSKEETQKEVDEDGFQKVVRKRRNKAFEKIIKVKGDFKNVIDLTMEEYRNSEKKMDIFTEKQEVYIVTAKLKPGQVTANKRTNEVKIIGEIVRDKVEPDDTKYNGFTSTDLIFKKMEEANKCFSIKDNRL